MGRDALVDLACDLLGMKPPSEITRASLARYAGVDPGLIRYYFKNRDSLLRTAAEELTRRLRERGETKGSEVAGLAPAERICTRAQALLSFKLDNPFYHRLMADEMGGSQDPQSRALFLEIATAAIERYRRYLEAGAADRSLRQVNPAFLYVAIVGLCDFFVTARPLLSQLDVFADEDAAQREYARFICDLMLDGLRAR